MTPSSSICGGGQPGNTSCTHGLVYIAPSGQTCSYGECGSTFAAGCSLRHAATAISTHARAVIPVILVLPERARERARRGRVHVDEVLQLVARHPGPDREREHVDRIGGGRCAQLGAEQLAGRTLDDGLTARELVAGDR